MDVVSKATGAETVPGLLAQPEAVLDAIVTNTGGQIAPEEPPENAMAMLLGTAQEWWEQYLENGSESTTPDQTLSLPRGTPPRTDRQQAPVTPPLATPASLQSSHARHTPNILRSKKKISASSTSTAMRKSTGQTLSPTKKTFLPAPMPSAVPCARGRGRRKKELSPFSLQALMRAPARRAKEALVLCHRMGETLLLPPLFWQALQPVDISAYHADREDIDSPPALQDL